MSRPLTLLWSSRSPFVRKVMIVAHEVGAADRIETVRTAVHPARPNDDVMAVHPLSKIPVLITEDRQAIYDSRVICEYLDERFGDGMLVPDGPARWGVLTRHAMVDALLETAILWRLEAARPAEQRQEDIEAASRRRVLSGLAALERDAPFAAMAHLTLDQVATVAALFYLSFRFADLHWQDRAPKLALWLSSVSDRPSIAQTAYLDVS